jgi:hypothetical protein
MKKSDKASQKTLKGHKIPIPTKADVFDTLEKAAKPVKPLAPRRRPKK